MPKQLTHEEDAGASKILDYRWCLRLGQQPPNPKKSKPELCPEEKIQILLAHRTDPATSHVELTAKLRSTAAPPPQHSTGKDGLNSMF